MLSILRKPASTRKSASATIEGKELTQSYEAPRSFCSARACRLRVASFARALPANATPNSFQLRLEQIRTAKCSRVLPNAAKAPKTGTKRRKTKTDSGSGEIRHAAAKTR